MPPTLENQAVPTWIPQKTAVNDSSQFKASRLGFRLLSHNPDDTSRRGELSFEDDKVGNESTENHEFSSKRVLQTPTIIVHSRRGAVPHLTRDNIARLPIEMVHISLEHLLETMPPTLSQAPFSIHRYFGLHQTEGQQQQILTMSLRDIWDKTIVPPNGDQSIVVTGFRGVRKITPLDYLKYSLPRPPDILFAPSDELSEDVLPSNKRIEKSVRRTLQWLAETKVENRNGITNMFAPLVGATSLKHRRIFSKSLVGEQVQMGFQIPLPPNQEALDSGFVGYTLSIPSSGSLAPYCDPKTVSSLLRSSLDPLPKTKPRIVLNGCGPHDILRLVKETGIDLFLDEWTSQCSSAGVGLDFDFPVHEPSLSFNSPKKSGKNGKRDIGHSYFEVEFERKFELLSESSLAHSRTESTAATHSQPFGPVAPTRAYVHHLLHAHEMTSHVILAIHNQTMMHNFMASIRRLLENEDGSGVFDKEVDQFFDIYEERKAFSSGGYECLDKAQASWNTVNKARGKGSLKEKKMADDGANMAGLKVLDSTAAHTGSFDRRVLDVLM